MNEAAKMRQERIERLLRELEYEIVRGVMEREIEPEMQYGKIFPCNGRGDNLAQLRVILSPATRHDYAVRHDVAPRLRLVE